MEKILIEVKDHESQVKQFKHELLKLVWYMRGGLSLNEAYMLGPDEREIISEIVKENFETTKKSGMPFF